MNSSENSVINLAEFLPHFKYILNQRKIMRKHLLKCKKAVFAICTAIIAVSFAYPPYTANAAKTLSQLKSERETLATKTKNAKSDLQKIQSEKADMSEQIKAMDSVINAAQQQLQQSQADLNEVNKRLEASKAALEEAKKNRENQNEVFGKRIKYFYEHGETGYIDIILEAKGVSDMLLRMQYVEDIMNYDKSLLDKLKATEDTIAKKTEEIKEEKTAAEEIVAENQKNEQEVQAELANKKAKMQQYAQNEANFKKLLADTEQSSKNIERLIQQSSSSSYSSKNSSSYVYTGGKLNWPVPSRAASPSSESSGFGYRSRPIGSGTEFHTGYDIPASYGSAIVAAESGTVIYAGWMNGYGNTIMINHGGGLVTLYGHNSSLTVSKGQTVKRGQQVARCGATGNATGNHCHFEVRLNGKAVSPEPYLGVKNIAG
jgi:murein DD-endopeptidase MepM/ murein hydrolase activator NlpD